MNFGLVRYLPDGTLDTRFGTGGIFTLDFFGSMDGVSDVEVLADGRIVAAGTARSGLAIEVALIRLLP